jgi:signal transduction histidine kinase/CheY-like chemotaxis protein
VKLNIVFDAIIALAYFSIPIEVAYFYHRHPTPQLFYVFVLFFSFIMLCGITHAIHALSPYELPTLHATFKVLCGLVSIITAVYLVRFIPAALKLPNYAAYLEYEIQERQISETTLRNKNEESKKLRSCTEKIRQTLHIQAILQETTSSLATQLDLETCFFIRHRPESKSLGLVAPYTGHAVSSEDEPPSIHIDDDANHPLLGTSNTSNMEWDANSTQLPYSLRSNHPDALMAFNSIVRGEHIRLLESSLLEDLFGREATSGYANGSNNGSSFSFGFNGSNSTPHRVPSLQLSKSTVCTHITMPETGETALLVLVRPVDGQVWSLSEIELVRDVANQVEIALAQARSIERDKDLLSELQTKNAELAQAQRRAESATQAKSKFIAIMSHEMRTPLYVVTALTELLMDTQLTNEQRESLTTIQTSSRLLLSIISDVLDYSKFQQDNFIMEKAPFNLRTCIEKCVDIASVKAKEVGLEVYYHLKEGIPEVVDTDEARLSQVFLNLLSNAVKFTTSGSLAVQGFLDRYLSNDEISQLYKTQFGKTDQRQMPNTGSSSNRKPTKKSSSSSLSSTTSSGSTSSNSSFGPVLGAAPSSGLAPSTATPSSAGPSSSNNPPRILPGTKMALLHFIVSDTGVGIPNDQIHRLFEEFTQLDTSVSRKYDGSGLGLAICRKVVTLMGGAIWVHSVPGIGSHFHFTIIAKVPPPSLAQPLMLPTPGARGMKVLAITPAAPLQSQISDFCRQMGMLVTFAKDVDHAFHTIRTTTTIASPFQTILLDSNVLTSENAVESFQKLNTISPTLMIGDISGLGELMSDEVEMHQILPLPLKYKNFYISIRLCTGSPPDSEVSYERLIADMLSSSKQRQQQQLFQNQQSQHLMGMVSTGSQQGYSSMSLGGGGGSNSSHSAGSSPNPSSQLPALPLLRYQQISQQQFPVQQNPSSDQSSPRSAGADLVPSSGAKESVVAPAPLSALGNASQVQAGSFGDSAGAPVEASISSSSLSLASTGILQAQAKLVKSTSGNSLSSAGSSESGLPSPRRYDPATLAQLTGQSSSILGSLGILPSSSSPSLDAHKLMTGPFMGYGAASGTEEPLNPTSSNPSLGPATSSLHASSSALAASSSSSIFSAATSLSRWENAKTLNILLVEDNIVCRKVCLKQLQKLGFERVDCAINGQDALDQVAKKQYELVMMDVMMPGVDGLSATRSIRQMGDDHQISRQQQPYIIAITASSMLEEGSREACFGAGMDDVVNKPIHLQALRDAIARFLESRFGPATA